MKAIKQYVGIDKDINGGMTDTAIERDRANDWNPDRDLLDGQAEG